MLAGFSRVTQEQGVQNIDTYSSDFSERYILIHLQRLQASKKTNRKARRTFIEMEMQVQYRGGSLCTMSRTFPTIYSAKYLET